MNCFDVCLKVIFPCSYVITILAWKCFTLKWLMSRFDMCRKIVFACSPVIAVLAMECFSWMVCFDMRVKVIFSCWFKITVFALESFIFMNWINMWLKIISFLPFVITIWFLTRKSSIHTFSNIDLWVYCGDNGMMIDEWSIPTWKQCYGEL